MLDVKFIRANSDLVKKNCQNRLADVDLDFFLDLDRQKRNLETVISSLRAERNIVSQKKPTKDEIKEMKNKGKKIQELEEKLKTIKKEWRKILLKIPNLTHPEVKISDKEDDNPVLEHYLNPPQFDFTPLDHVQLSKKLDLIDFERATKVVGSKFYYLKKSLALMEIALIQYALEVVEKFGFTPFITPDLAKKEILEGLGFQPRGESTQVYNIENTDLSLIGTAEITMGGYHANEIIPKDELPKKYVAVSHCFRTEAGSYSKFSKGIFRVHQFSKIEMFQYTLPEKSEIAHREMLDIEKEIFRGLEIPFRVVDHCTADLGTPATRTYDLEAWMPGKAGKDGKRGDWAEITSTSNCTDYQARGLNIKYQAGKDKQYVHTLNGTAIAITRAIIAIMENYQQKDGSIKVPEVLQKWMRIKKIKN